MPSHTYNYGLWTDYLSEQPLVSLPVGGMLSVLADITSPNTVSYSPAGLIVQADCITGVVRQAGLAFFAECLSLPLTISDHNHGQVGISWMIQPVPLSLSPVAMSVGIEGFVTPSLVELSSGVQLGVSASGAITPELVPLSLGILLSGGISGKVSPYLIPQQPPVTLSAGVAGQIISIEARVATTRGMLSVFAEMTSGPPPGSDMFADLFIGAEMKSRLQASFQDGALGVFADMSSVRKVSQQAGGMAILPYLSPYVLPRRLGWGAMMLSGNVAPYLLPQGISKGVIAIVPEVTPYQLPRRSTLAATGVSSLVTPYLLPRQSGEYNLGISGDSQPVLGDRSVGANGLLSVAGSFDMPPQLTLNMNHAYSLGAE